MKLLAIRFSALGDVAMAAAIVREVLEMHPDMEIDVLTKPFTAKAFPPHPRLKVIPADVNTKYKGLPGLYRLFRELKKNAQYDAVADLHGVLRSKVISRFFGLYGVPAYTINKGRAGKKALTRRENKVRGALKPTTERYADVFRQCGLKLNLHHALKRQITGQGKVGFAPMAKHREKQWPQRHVREFLESASQKNMAVVLYGSPGERPALEALAEGLSGIEIHNSRDLQDDIDSMRTLECMISMDSANMHLASLAGIPVVSIWGATHPDAGFMGYGQSVENAVQIPVEELECRPCSVFGNKTCFRGDWACLERLSAESVLSRVEGVINSKKPK